MRARAFAMLAGLTSIAACGGKLLPFASSSFDGGAGDDAAGGAVGALPSSDDGAGGAQGTGGSSGYAGSSSSSGSDSSSGGYGYGSAAGGSSGTSSIFSSSGGIPTPCLSVADCTGGRVCCADIDLRTGCFVGGCPSTVSGPIQLCVSASECVIEGDVCTSLAIAPQDPITACRKLPGASDP
ncbi:MAG: hypothetical protein ACRENE_21650 [Polyangiaceae bacterium]